MDPQLIDFAIDLENLAINLRSIDTSTADPEALRTAKQDIANFFATGVFEEVSYLADH